MRSSSASFRRKSRYAEAVVAKPSGTLMPSRDSSLIISPSEAFLPPTRATSSMPLSANQTTCSVNDALPCQYRPMMNNKRLMPRRTVFFVSDQTGVTAETLGHSLLTQFDGVEFAQVTVPFVDSVEKAQR